VLRRTGYLFNKGKLTMTLGATHNRPVNTANTLPTPSANESQGVEQAGARSVNLGEGQRTAEGLPPKRSRVESFKAAASQFFKGLTDRLPTIKMPSLPRISLRRQEAAQAEAAAPQRPADPFEAAMGGKPVSTKVRADFTAFAQVASAPGTTNAKIIDHVLALPEGNAVAKAFDTLATERMDQPNLQVMKALRSEEGLPLSHLVSNFVKPGSEQELNLFHKKGLVPSIVDINGKLNKSGLKDAVVRQVPNESGSGFSLQVSSPRGAVGGEAIDLLRQMEVQVGILAGSVHDEMSSQLKSMKGGGLMDAVAQRPEQKLFRAGLAALGEGAAAVGNAAASSQAEIGTLAGLSNSKTDLGAFAEQLRNDPSQLRHIATLDAGSVGRRAFETFAAAQPPGISRQELVQEFFVDMSTLNRLDAMSTPDFAELLKDAPSLARFLPQMGLGGEARQAFMAYAVAQPPGTSMQDKVEGFYDQVKKQVETASLVKSKLMDALPEEPAQLPSVHLDSLAHLLPLSDQAVQQGKSMEGLREFTLKEFSPENMDFIATGAALLRFENALGHEVPPNFAINDGAATPPILSLNFDLTVVRQWAARFVGGAAPNQVNLSASNARTLQNALNSLPADSAAVTDAQLSALTDAMANACREAEKKIKEDTVPRYQGA